MGKGDCYRPVKRVSYESNWDKIFSKKNKNDNKDGRKNGAKRPRNKR